MPRNRAKLVPDKIALAFASTVTTFSRRFLWSIPLAEALGAALLVWDSGFTGLAAENVTSGLTRR